MLVIVDKSYHHDFSLCPPVRGHLILSLFVVWLFVFCCPIFAINERVNSMFWKHWCLKCSNQPCCFQNMELNSKMVEKIDFLQIFTSISNNPTPQSIPMFESSKNFISCIIWLHHWSGRFISTKLMLTRCWCADENCFRMCHIIVPLHHLLNR